MGTHLSPVLHIFPSRRLGSGYHTNSLRAFALFHTTVTESWLTPRPGCQVPYIQYPFTPGLIVASCRPG